MLKISALILSLFLLMSQASAAIIAGNPKGKVTLLEVMDYQCIHCHRMHPIINWLIIHDHNLKVKYIPVAIINHNSLVDAASSYAMANETHKFIQYHNYLMSHPVNTIGVYNILKRLNLNTEKFKRDMHSKWVLRQIKSGLSLLNKYHSGTPLILVYPSNQPNHIAVFKGETNPGQLINAIKEDSL